LKLVYWKLPNEAEKSIKTGKTGRLPFDDADVLVMSGTSEMAGFDTPFHEMGLKYQTVSSATPMTDLLLIASRSPLTDTVSESASLLGLGWLETYLPEYALKILGIHLPLPGGQMPCGYMPCDQEIQSQTAFFEKIIHFTQAQIIARVIICGSFSMPAGSFEEILYCKRYFQSLAEHGWIDARRTLRPITYEQLWFNNAKKGIQLDLAILSPSLCESLRNAYHSRIPMGSHSQNVSKALIVELE
jgi:hypothetical protein